MRLALLAFLLVCLPLVGALSEEPRFLSQPYVAVRGGWSNLRDMPVDYHHDAKPDRDIGFDNGWLAGLAVGTQPRDWLRVELELSHRQHAVALVMPGSGAGGSAGATAGMVNAYLDIPTGGRFTPYFGIGIGAASLAQQDIRADGAVFTDDRSWAFAYQAMAGVSARLAPLWSSSLEYRWFGASSPVFSDREGYFYDSETRAHALVVGVTRSLW